MGCGVAQPNDLTHFRPLVCCLSISAAMR
jgi:hypothetical protein